MLEMNGMDILLILGGASLLAMLWSVQPGKWQTVKDRVLLVSFFGLLASGITGAILNAIGGGH